MLGKPADGTRRGTGGLTAAEFDGMIRSGVISGRMMPKIHCALHAVRSGVTVTHIDDGRVEHAVLLELLPHEGVGTLISR